MFPIINTAIDRFDHNQSPEAQYYHTIIIQIKNNFQDLFYSQLKDCIQISYLILEMTQQPILDVAVQNINFSMFPLKRTNRQSQHNEVFMFQVPAKKLYSQQTQQNQLCQIIQMLQTRSQNAYSQLRQLTLQYNQKFDLYNSKIDNRNEDIYEQRDKIQSNIYYTQQQNKLIDQQCKIKLEERRKIQQQIETYNSKREQIASLLTQQKAEIARKTKINKVIEENIRITREEYEIYQEQIFEVDIKGQNLKKYGYEIVPQKILKLIEIRDALQRQLDDMDSKKEVQQKIFGKLIKLQISRRILKDFQEQKQRKKQLQNFNVQNSVLKSQNQKLNQVKYAYQWNPNLEIKQLQVNLQEEQKKIEAIQKQMFSTKRKITQTNKKMKQYQNHFENFEELNSLQKIVVNDLDCSPHKFTDKKQKKDKTKKLKQHPLYQQIKSDLVNCNQTKPNWKNILGFEKRFQSIDRKKFSYKVQNISRKVKIFVISLLVLGVAYMCHITNRK